ncbi:hypothetical protein FF011L_06340 [Roseimaritima multifibrata]|uniref:Uncharacterized protein n=1 Tax=Roseimaritima multifibrata TaxID=1930274 RepID=A0A517MAK0_9BACT|nr:hypothetical protein [Roseimaritima multifibrata]QDS91898.1 hypothetical protein FF011L_06340 [Roseimaritima multifibrata]
MSQGNTSPSSLVAVANAAHVAGDKPLLESTKRLLEKQFGIVIRFTRPTKPNGGPK